uniref:Uncharacterized protein n=1 Tax=Romanomermis culicivorax TaxID=13658 RepID=A0A915J9N0_ROMCU
PKKAFLGQGFFRTGRSFPYGILVVQSIRRKSPVVSPDTEFSEDHCRKVRESRFIDWENTTWVTYKEGEISNKGRSVKPKSRLGAFAKEYYPDGVPLETVAYYKELNDRRKNVVDCKLDMSGFDE